MWIRVISCDYVILCDIMCIYVWLFYLRAEDNSLHLSCDVQRLKFAYHHLWPKLYELVIACGWLHVASCGYYWILLASNGIYWHRLASIGIDWHLLATGGYPCNILQYLAIPCNPLQFQNVSDSFSMFQHVSACFSMFQQSIAKYSKAMQSSESDYIRLLTFGNIW